MKDEILKIISKYLEIFPEEAERQSNLIKYLEEHEENEITNWNNFDGHICAGGFIYSLQDKKFLLLHHKALNMYLHPGGHVDPDDISTLSAAKREIQEETGVVDLEQGKIVDDELIPIDIDTHVIKRNEKKNLPEHYHFELRYLFVIDKIKNIKIDTEESTNYKWVDIDVLYKESSYENITRKIEKLLLKY